jgi:hypothetical protein
MIEATESWLWESENMMKLAHRLGILAIFGMISAVSSGGLALAAPISFTVPLTGAQQVPPVATSGSGTANLTYNPSTRAVTWSITYHGLSGPATMAHFHGPAGLGGNAGVQIWLTKKGGPVPNPITGHATLTPAQAQQFMAGQWYINVHTKDHPDGEIRGQVMPPKG